MRCHSRHACTGTSGTVSSTLEGTLCKGWTSCKHDPNGKEAKASELLKHDDIETCGRTKATDQEPFPRRERETSGHVIEGNYSSPGLCNPQRALSMRCKSSCSQCGAITAPPAQASHDISPESSARDNRTRRVSRMQHKRQKRLCRGVGQKECQKSEYS